jgi:hypothetical protein
MILRDNGHAAFVEQWQHPEIRGADGKAEERDIGEAAGQCLAARADGVLTELDKRIWVVSGERAQDPGGELVSRLSAEADAQPAIQSVAIMVCLGLDRGRGTEGTAGRLEERLSSRGQFDVLAAAVEEPHAELLLEASQLLAQGGL